MKPVNIIGEYYATKIPDKVPVRLNKNRVEYGVPRGGIFYKQLPPGPWSIVSTSDEMTEEIARKIVDVVLYDVPPSPGNDFQGDWRTAFRDYESQEETGCSEFPYVLKATESFQSLLKSHGLEGRQLIIKKEL